MSATKGETSTSCFKSEVKVLLKNFLFIGLPMYGNFRSCENSILSYIKLSLKLVLETFFVIFNVYTLLSCAFWMPYWDTFLRLSTSAMSVITFLLRMSIAFKRNSIMDVVYQIQNFINAFQTGPYIKKRKRIFYLCFLNILCPFIVSCLFMTFAISRSIDLKDEFAPKILPNCKDNRLCIGAFMFALNTLYTLNYYVVPSLIMSLFYFVGISYVDALKNILWETHLKISSSPSLTNIARGADLISAATRLHQEIEKALSFSIFLAYVLVFVYFLNLVAVNVSDIAWSMPSVRNIGSICIFLWTFSYFVQMTLTGSKLVDVCDAWDLLRHDIVREIVHLKNTTTQELMHLQLFMESSRINLAFSGWGMFRLDRGLLLTMTEVIVSYSVLVATV